MHVEPPPEPTVSVYVVEWPPEDAVPVTVIGYVPAAAEDPALAVSVEVPPEVTLLGLNETVTPAGTPLAVSATLSALPPVTAVGTWSATKFYSFFQEVDYEENFWSEDDMTENISEMFSNSESRLVVVDPGALPNSDPETAKLLDIRSARMP